MHVCKLNLVLFVPYVPRASNILFTWRRPGATTTARKPPIAMPVSRIPLFLFRPPNEKRSSSIFGQTRQKQPEDRKSGFSFRRSSSSQRPRPSVRSPLYSTPGFHMQRAGGPTDGRRDGWSDRKQVPPSPSPSQRVTTTGQRPAVYIHRAHKPYMTVASVGRSVGRSSSPPPPNWPRQPLTRRRRRRRPRLI